MIKKISLVLAVACFMALPILSIAKEVPQDWELVNPEGVVKIEPMKINPHPGTLEGKTVVLHWNGKHNGDNFLGSVGELLSKQIKDIKVIKAWEKELWLATPRGPADESLKRAKKIAEFKPDLVIGSQAD